MLLKLKNKLITILAVIAATIFVGVSAFSIVNNVLSEEPVINPDSIATVLDDYALGSTLDVPDSVTISYKNGTYTSDNAYLYSPDGKVYTASDCVLSTVGVYKLVYYVDVDGKTVSAEKTFTVSKTPVNVKDNITVDNLDALTVVSDSGLGGLKVNVPNRATFEWTEAIDLKELGKDNAFFSFTPYEFSGLKVGEDGKSLSQLKTIYVRITDAYNPNIYVNYRIQNYTKNNDPLSLMPSYTVGANQQPMRAMSTNTGRPSQEGELLTIDNQLYFVSYQGWGGYPLNGNLDTTNGSLISFYFDVETAQAFVSQRTEGDNGNYVKSMISDLDAKEIYSVNGFKGFTTGEVYLTVYGEAYKTSDNSFDMEVASIGNYVGAELFEKDLLKDDKAPLLKVDITEEQKANGIFVPKGATVRLPDYTFYDVNMKNSGMGYITVRLGDKDNGELIAVKNGTFFAKTEGAYYVTYTAVDDFGNTTDDSKYTYVFNCYDASANGNKTITFNAQKYTATVTAGSTITLPDYSIETLNKFYNVKAYYYYANQVNDKVAIDLDNPQVRLDNVGKYTIVYEYSDVYEADKFSYELTTVASNDFEFTKVVLPRYMINNATYTLEDVYAKVFIGSKPELKDASVQVSVDGEAYTSVADYSAYKVTATSTLQFKYSYTLNGNTKSIESEVIPVISANYGFKSKLLYSKYLVDHANDGVPGATVAVSTSNVISINATGTKDSPIAKTTNGFVNQVSISAFEFAFEVVAGDFDNLTFTLTDIYDANKVMVISYVNTGAKVIISFNDESTSASVPFKDTSFNFKYKKSAGGFTDENLSTYFMYTDKFTSDYAYLDISLNNVYGNASVEIKKIGNSNFKENATDNVKPTIYYDDSYCGNKKLNQTITLSRGYGFDLACPVYYTDSRFHVSIEYQPDLETDTVYMKDVNGLTLEEVSATVDYQVVLDRVGIYTVTYVYKDANNQTAYAFGTINVVDQNPPKIVLDGGYNESTVVEAEKGGIHEAKGYTVSDDVDASEDLTVIIVVIDPLKNMHDLTDNDFEYDDMTFDLDLYGEYKVIYYVRDASNNETILSYTVFVD